MLLYNMMNVAELKSGSKIPAVRMEIFYQAIKYATGFGKFGENRVDMNFEIKSLLYDESEEIS